MAQRRSRPPDVSPPVTPKREASGEVSLSSLTTPQLRALHNEACTPLLSRLPVPEVPSSRAGLVEAIIAAGVPTRITRAKLDELGTGKPSPDAARSKRRGGSANDSPARTTPRVWGAHAPHGHLSAKNLLNAFIFALVMVPSIACALALFDSGCAPCSAPAAPPPAKRNLLQWLLGVFAERKGPAVAAVICNEWPLAEYLGSAASLLGNPLWAVNLGFFANVTVGFWIIGLLQHSFWLIDPYWTILPPMICHFYRAHPCAESPSPLRGSVSLALVWLWSVRLTHSYFRREGWKFGEQEDWRYTKMAADLPRTWWLVSFFAVGLAQQPMLVGISYPVHFAHTSSLPWTAYDSLAAALALTGITGAYFSDTQLARFMSFNRRRRAAGEPTVALLRAGLWRYSRHPNYFFEQLFWWSISLFAANVGHPEAMVGTVLNSLVLLTVTFMTEAKMLREWAPSRAQLYREYRRTTSMWLPLPNWR